MVPARTSGARWLLGQAPLEGCVVELPEILDRPRAHEVPLRRLASARLPRTFAEDTRTRAESLAVTLQKQGQGRASSSPAPPSSSASASAAASPCPSSALDAERVRPIAAAPCRSCCISCIGQGGREGVSLLQGEQKRACDCVRQMHILVLMKSIFLSILSQLQGEQQDRGGRGRGAAARLHRRERVLGVCREPVLRRPRTLSPRVLRSHAPPSGRRPRISAVCWRSDAPRGWEKPFVRKRDRMC